MSFHYGPRNFTIAKSFLFDGVDEYFNADTLVANVSTDTVGTINVLVKTENVTPSATFHFFSFSDTNQATFIVLNQQTNGKIRLNCTINNVFQFRIDTTSAIDLTSWTLISAVQNGTQPVIYVNGVAVAQTNVTATDLTRWVADCTGVDNCRIGALFYTAIAYGKGYISQCSYLNTDISSAQVLDLYNNGKPKNPQTVFGANCKLFFNPDNSGSTAQFAVIDRINSITSTSVNMENADKTTETPYTI
jgi:hypothetical protein